MTEPRDFNAYRRAPVLRPGCTHQLGCRCDPPFWLRPSTPAEEAIADRIYGISAEVQAGKL
jgi:hypothetical protein